MADDDKTPTLSETQILRQSWQSAATQVVNKLVAGKPVPPSEVESLQRALENIEARELFEEARDITLAGG